MACEVNGGGNMLIVFLEDVSSQRSSHLLSGTINESPLSYPVIYPSLAFETENCSVV